MHICIAWALAVSKFSGHGLGWDGRCPHDNNVTLVVLKYCRRLCETTETILYHGIGGPFTEILFHLRKIHGLTLFIIVEQTACNTTVQGHYHHYYHYYYRYCYIIIIIINISLFIIFVIIVIFVIYICQSLWNLCGEQQHVFCLDSYSGGSSDNKWNCLETVTPRAPEWFRDNILTEHINIVYIFIIIYTT